MSTRPVANADYADKMSDARKWSNVLLKEVADAYGLDADRVRNLETEDYGPGVVRDLHGIDAELHFPGGTRTVAFRTRPEHPRFDVDFSLRTRSRDNMTESEWTKLKMIAYNDPYPSLDIPDYYVFAITSSSGIQVAWLMRTDWLISALWDDQDPEQEYEEKQSENGGKARYIPMSDIQSAVVAKLV